MSTAGGAVEIWTDGACLGNPGPGGWGAILRAGSREKELSGGEPQTTNNRMELLAAISALEALTRPSTVRLVSDSEYVIKGITQWLPGWRAKGWKKVKNRDLWERLAEVTSTHDVTWEWVRGHSGDVMNERVDKLAVAEAAQQKAIVTGIPVAPRKGKAKKVRAGAGAGVEARAGAAAPAPAAPSAAGPVTAFAVVRIDDAARLAGGAAPASVVTVVRVTRERPEAEAEAARLSQQGAAAFVQPVRVDLT